MKYQIVLQWPASSIQDYDAMIALENLLIDKLPNGSKVDGHDGGSGQVNVFIHTDSPGNTFASIKDVLEEQDALSNVKAAYRVMGSSEYTILWPKNLTEFEVL
jgi:hypothetical protein